MYALSVQQPWSWAILRGGKTVENRRNKRGPAAAKAMFNRPGARIALHAGQRYAGTEAYNVVKNLCGEVGHGADTAGEFGAFIGLVTLESLHLGDECYDPVTGRFCSPWAEPHAAHLVFTDPVVLHRPVAAPGRLGLWEITDTDLVAEITRQAA